jgi:hypothetical protein
MVDEDEDFDLQNVSAGSKMLMLRTVNVELRNTQSDQEES